MRLQLHRQTIRPIDQVIARLSRVVQRERDNKVGLFAALYRQVTLAVKQGIDEGRFEDGARMERLDVAFAGRYFAAYEAWAAGRPLSGCWRVAFTESARGETCLLQDLLLGINAHINLDLGVAANAVAGDDIEALQRDFFTINELLEELLDDVEAALGRYSPLISALDYLGGRADERAGSFVMALARDASWRHALALSEMSPRERVAYILDVDEVVTDLARRIVRPPGLLAGWVLRLVRATERAPVERVVDDLDSIFARRRGSLRAA